jgi:archaetidylinositol phosphate synthase
MRAATVSPKRWNDGFFQPLERPALAWLAAHMPRWMTPDHLTAIGFFGALITFIGYAASGSRPAVGPIWSVVAEIDEARLVGMESESWVASLGLVVNWFGDSLDGTVARLRKIERPRYGYYLDNAIDCIAQLLLAIGIGLSGHVRLDLCLLALVAYLMVSTLSFIRANVSGVFQISYAAVGPTEVRVGFVVLNALLIIFPPDSIDWGLPLTYPNLWSLAWSAATLVTFLVCTVKQVRQLAIEEPAREYAAPLPRSAAWREADAGWLGLNQAVAEPVPTRPNARSHWRSGRMTAEAMVTAQRHFLRE